MRYHFTPGDRLVYRETFDREGISPDSTFHARVPLLNQLIVLDSAPGSFLLGVQRNRQSAQLLESHERGADTLAQQKQVFDQNMTKRPAHFSDTNLISATGQPLLPQQVLREATSKLLYNLGEIMPVPAPAVQLGSEWDLGALGMRMKLESFETVGGESCAVFTGTRKDNRLQFTFCPHSGHMRKLAFEGAYPEFESTIRERITFELLEVHHQETGALWLADPQAQLAALRALMIGNAPLPDTSVLQTILKSGSPEVQVLALALYLQRGITPPQDILQSFQQNPDPELRRIAARFTQPPPKPPTQPCEMPAVHHTREKPGATLRFMTTPGLTGTPYMIHVPPDYRGDQPFPLLVYLSGGGGLAFDGVLSSADAVRHAGYLVLYPNAGGQMWWDASVTAMVQALLLEVQRTYDVDANRVYLAGFSNGGTGTIELGARFPYHFAALASLMGAGLDTPSGAKLPMQNLLAVPVLFLHGDKDPRIPPSASTITYEALRGFKPATPPEIHVLKSREHDVTLSSDDGYTLPFFARFTRDPFPKVVKAKIFDPRFPRQYWIEVIEGDKAAAELEGRILPDNIIELKTHNVKKLRLLLRPELLPAPGPLHIRLNGKDQLPYDLKRDCQLFLRTADSTADPFLAYTDEIVLAIPD